MASNSRLLTCSENLCVWNLSITSCTLLHKFAHSTAKSFTTLAWDSADQFVCVPTEEKKLTFFDFLQDEITHKEYDVGVNVTAVSCGQKSSNIALGSATGEVLCWNKKQEKIVKTIAELPSGVTSLQYNVADSHVAVGCINGMIGVYNTTSGFSGVNLKRDDELLAVRNVHFHQKHKFLLGSCYDIGQVLLWDVHKSCLYQTLSETHKSPAMDLRFSPLGNSIVASVGLDKQILLHDVRLKRTVQNIRCEVPLRTVDFLPGGVALVVGGSKGIVCVYDLRTPTHPHSFKAHTQQVQKVAVNSVRADIIKKKRDEKPRSVLSSNQGQNSNRDRHVSSNPSTDDICSPVIPNVTGQEQVRKEASDTIRKIVLKKSLERTTATSNQEHMSMETPPVTNSPDFQFDIENLFSPPRTDFVSDNKENLHLAVPVTTTPEEQDVCMDTEVIRTPEVSVDVKEKSQKVAKENLVEFSTEGFHSLHMDVMNMHFQMVKQFTAQQIQIRELQETCTVNHSLVEEVQFLREENRRLKTLLDSLRNKC